MTTSDPTSDLNQQTTRPTPLTKRVDGELEPTRSAAPALARPQRSHATVWGWVAVAACLTPLVVSAGKLLGDRWFPSGDTALLELITRDIGHHAVLIGPYSRGNWHHPGPTIYYAFFAPYHLTGESSIALPMTALAINAASIAGMAVIARRLAGTGFMIATVLGLAVLVRSLGAEFIRSPWNPTITVLPFGLLTYLTWAMTCRVRWALPVAAVVATFLVQTHIGYVPIALPLLGLGASRLIMDAIANRRDAHAAPTATAKQKPLGRWIAATLGVLTVMWLPPTIDEITNDPGNVSAVIEYFRTTDEPTHSLLDGLNAISPQFAVFPAWITGDRPIAITGEPISLNDPAVPMLALVVVAAATVVVRRGPLDARRYVATIAIAIGLGIASIARTPGPLYMYRLDWLPLVGMFAFMTVALAVPLVLPTSTTTRLRRPTIVAAAVTVIALAVANGIDAIQADLPQRRFSDAIAELAPDVVADLPDQSGQVVFRRGPDFIAGSVGRGLELNLERSGVWTVAGGEEVQDHPIRAEYLITTDAQALDLETDPNYELVARSGPTNPEQRESGEHLIAVYRIVQP